ATWVVSSSPIRPATGRRPRPASLGPSHIARPQAASASRPRVTRKSLLVMPMASAVAPGLVGRGHLVDVAVHPDQAGLQPDRPVADVAHRVDRVADHEHGARVASQLPDAVLAAALEAG